MRIQKFQASDMREAIVQVKRALGSDAVIVSTRDIRRGLLGKGVEVTAAIDAPDEPETPAQVAAPAARASMSDADVERFLLPLRSELRTLHSMMRSERGMIEAMRRQISDMAGRGPAGPSLDDCARSPGLVSSSNGRIVALVGPTGVGKTTTIAKLAARAALVEEKRVAIITLDGYRVGGEEQMRTFADLIGVPMFSASGPMSLARTLRATASMEKIFIDTAGRSPRDGEAIAALQTTMAVVDDPETHLVVPAGASLATIESIHARFKPLQPSRLLFTKTDEADDLPQIVQAPVKLGLSISFITTGQRVPEDLEDATTTRLLAMARRAEIVT